MKLIKREGNVSQIESFGDLVIFSESKPVVCGKLKSFIFRFKW